MTRPAILVFDDEQTAGDAVAMGRSVGSAAAGPAALLQDRSGAAPVLRAMTLGVVDTYLPSPLDTRDDGFHQAVSELLEEWAFSRGQDRPAMYVIGDEDRRGPIPRRKGSPRLSSARPPAGRPAAAR